MSKIICSLEDWDSIFNYHRPNGSSKTWYIRETKKMSIPYMWGDWNILNEDGEMFENEQLKAQITPQYSKLIEYTPKESIKNSPHIYIITNYVRTFFTDNYDIGFKCVSPEYLKDVRDGKSKILILFIYEGYSGSDIENNNDFEIIEKWRIDSNLPENSVYYLNGNLLSEEIVKDKGYKFIAKGIHYFEPWNKYNGEMVEFKPIDERNLFLSYNRATRSHRIRFIVDLFENNIIDRGLISINKLYEAYFPITPEVKEFFDNKTPMTIDSVSTLKYNLAINITVEDYEKTFISVVTETLSCPNTLFFSEKIWKPIMVGHPFIVFGNQYSLKYLKGLGFKTFDKWINESYDNEPDSDTRSKMIVNELMKFEKMGIDELQKVRKEMYEICQHNYNHFKTYYYQKYGDNDESKTIRDILLEIWNDISDIKPKRSLI